MSVQLTDNKISEIKNGTILNGVNCKNTMGDVQALNLVEHFPFVKESYHCISSHMMKLGKTQYLTVNDDLTVVNCWIQQNYGNDGKVYADLRAIRTCLNKALKYTAGHDEPINKVLWSPKLGCGLGGLDWDLDVEPLFKEMSEKYPTVQIRIYSI